MSINIDIILIYEGSTTNQWITPIIIWTRAPDTFLFYKKSDDIV